MFYIFIWVPVYKRALNYRNQDILGLIKRVITCCYYSPVNRKLISFTKRMRKQCSQKTIESFIHIQSVLQFDLQIRRLSVSSPILQLVFQSLMFLIHKLTYRSNWTNQLQYSNVWRDICHINCRVYDLNLWVKCL